MTDRQHRRWTVSGMSLLLAVSAASGMHGAPSLWQRAKDPLADKRAELLLRVDRKREPIDDTFDSPQIRTQLHRAAATWLELAGVEGLQDVELLYLYGECLAYAGPVYLERAKAVLQQALSLAPEHPAASGAWDSLGRVAGALGEYGLQYSALEQVFELEWDQSVRVDVLIEQGLGALSAEELTRAIERLRGARDAAEEPSRWALSQWALAVAMDRALLGPVAEQLAFDASAARFGSQGNSDVLALPAMAPDPPLELLYYRALALMGKARQGPVAQRVTNYQDAKFMWLRYLDAVGPAGTWTNRVRAHLRAIRQHTAAEDSSDTGLDQQVLNPVDFDPDPVDAGVEAIWPEELKQGAAFWGDASAPDVN